MVSTTLDGPVVPRDVHNIVLRDVRFHSPIKRVTSTTNFALITIGIREGEYTTWVGSWDQSSQSIEGASPSSALDDARHGMRLKSEQSVVVKVEVTGSPQTLQGARVNFLLARVGGRSGQARPLVAAGAQVADADTATALSALETQVNSGLSEWEESVQLTDPVGLVTSGTFQGRLQLDTAIQISLQRFTGNWVEVAGEAISIGSDGLTVASTDGLLSSSGGITATAPSISTLYYAYVGEDGLRLSATAPSSNLGTLYLGTDSTTSQWRFAGWVYVNGSSQFADSETAREVVNYYNRQIARLYTCPAYSDDGLWTSYIQSSVNWAKLNAGTGSDVTFIANGEDSVELIASMRAVLNNIGQTYGVAIGTDFTTAATVEVEATGTNTGVERKNYTAPLDYSPAVGHHTASILGRQNAGIATIYADAARYGAVADPAETYLVGWVMT